MKQKRPKIEKPPRTIPFWNNKGEQINIPESYKMDDLLRMGVKEIRVLHESGWLPDGWYSTEKPKKKGSKEPLHTLD